jgi:hypothetical protein
MTCENNPFCASPADQAERTVPIQNGGIARRVDLPTLVTDCEPLPVDDSDRFDLDRYSGRACVPTHHGLCRLWSANGPRPGCVDGRQVLVPVTGEVDRDLRDFPWAGARGGERGRDWRTPAGPGDHARSHSWLARSSRALPIYRLMVRPHPGLSGLGRASRFTSRGATSGCAFTVLVCSSGSSAAAFSRFVPALLRKRSIALRKRPMA